MQHFCSLKRGNFSYTKVLAKLKFLLLSTSQILKDVSLLTRSKEDTSTDSIARAACSIKNVLEQRVRLFAMNLQQFNSLTSHDQVKSDIPIVNFCFEPFFIFEQSSQILILENSMGLQLALKIMTFFNFEVPRSNGNRYKETHKTKFFHHLLNNWQPVNMVNENLSC